MSKNKAPLEPNIYRVIDANLNRFKEGIRVVEDIFRYVYNNKTIAKELKEIRHKAVYEDKRLIEFRDTQKDVLKQSINQELNKESLESIIKANIKRSQEASRVLEEMFKLIDTEYSELFKRLRYRLYKIEKDITLLKKVS
jgi:thiamine-phosphate pyrophosphorylase